MKVIGKTAKGVVVELTNGEWPKVARLFTPVAVMNAVLDLLPRVTVKNDKPRSRGGKP